MSEIRIQPLAHGDERRAAAVLAEAFAPDPLFAAALPDPGSRPARIERFYFAVLRAVQARGDVVDAARVAGDERIAGIAHWGTPDRQSGAALHFLMQVPRFVQALGLRGASRLARHEQVVERHRPHADHWYLHSIAVAGWARGLGAGSALLRTRLDEVDADGRPAFLDATTPDSRRLYERYGFRAVATVAKVGDVGTTAMVREPSGF